MSSDERIDAIERSACRLAVPAQGCLLPTP